LETLYVKIESFYPPKISRNGKNSNSQNPLQFFLEWGETNYTITESTSSWRLKEKKKKQNFQWN